MSPEQRSDISNGIWLCQHHGRVIDRDKVSFTVERLREMKRCHEESRSFDPNLRDEERSLPDDASVILIPFASDSRIITGDMIVRGGNYINGTPFAFEAALTLRASTAGDLVKFECALYRERNVTTYPPGKSMDDYTPEAWAALPTKPVRDYARNKAPARLSGAYGIYSGGTSTSPIAVSEPMFIINGQDILLRGDFVTLTKPYRLEAGQAVMVRYGRLCAPAIRDEAPADYIYDATIECRLEFLASTERAAKKLSWVLDYSRGGTLSLRD